MKGEDIKAGDEIGRVCSGIMKLILPEMERSRGRYVISIAGESGVGKTSLAALIREDIQKSGKRAVCIQQDDYFKLPPGTNFKARRKDPAIVGVSEVYLDLMQEHVDLFKAGALTLDKPLVSFGEDRIGREEIGLEGAGVLIVEGTYVTVLKNVDKRIFLEGTYADTLDGRIKRNREAEDGFSARILGIEHDIIIKHKALADIVVSTDHTIEARG